MVQAVYGLWLAHNDAREGKKISEAHEISHRVAAFVKEWEEIHKKGVMMKPPKERAKWEPPDPGWIKANTDGSVSKHLGKGGIGVVLRDDTGAFRAAACQVVATAIDSERVELLACRKAIELARDVGVGKLHLECDSARVVSMLNNREKNLSTAGPIVEDVKTKLKGFEEFKVSWVSRSANSAADKLAKMGMGDELNDVWLSAPPDCILHVISDEIPALF